MTDLAALAEAWVDAAAAYENAPSTGKFAAGYNAVRAAKTAFIQALAAKDAEITRLEADSVAMMKQIEESQQRRQRFADSLEANLVPHRCPICDGRGQVQFNPAMPFGDGASCGPWPCKPCNASGIVWNVWANSRPHPMTPAPSQRRG